MTFQKPKTARVRRMVSLPNILLQELAAHEQGRGKRRLQLGSLWQALDLVFRGQTGRPLYIPNLTYRYFQPILDRPGLPRIRL